MDVKIQVTKVSNHSIVSEFSEVTQFKKKLKTVVQISDAAGAVTR